MFRPERVHGIQWKPRDTITPLGVPLSQSLECWYSAQPCSLCFSQSISATIQAWDRQVKSKPTNMSYSFREVVYIPLPHLSDKKSNLAALFWNEPPNRWIHNQVSTRLKGRHAIARKVNYLSNPRTKSYITFQRDPQSKVVVPLKDLLRVPSCPCPCQFSRTSTISAVLIRKRSPLNIREFHKAQ
jgi:hypothetical protein